MIALYFVLLFFFTNTFGGLKIGLLWIQTFLIYPQYPVPRAPKAFFWEDFGGLKIGYLKPVDVFLSQLFSVLIVNVITCASCLRYKFQIRLTASSLLEESDFAGLR